MGRTCSPTASGSARLLRCLEARTPGRQLREPRTRPAIVEAGAPSGPALRRPEPGKLLEPLESVQLLGTHRNCRLGHGAVEYSNTTFVTGRKATLLTGAYTHCRCEIEMSGVLQDRDVRVCLERQERTALRHGSRSFRRIPPLPCGRYQGVRDHPSVRRDPSASFRRLCESHAAAPS